MAGVAGDGSGGFAFTDATFFVVRYVSPAGVISTIAGTGLGFTGSTGNGGAAYVPGPRSMAQPASSQNKPHPPPLPRRPLPFTSSAARLNSPYMVVGDTASVLVVDRGNHAVRRLYTANLSFAAATVAGVMALSGSTGNGGPASLAKLNNPYSIASDGSGGWLIVRQMGRSESGGCSSNLGIPRPPHSPPQVDLNNAWVRRVFANGTIVVAAGNHSSTLGADGRPGTCCVDLWSVWPCFTIFTFPRAQRRKLHFLRPMAYRLSTP